MENETSTDIPEAPASVVAEFEELGTPAQLSALYGALAKAQGEFAPIVKSRSVTVQMKAGGKYTYDYAPMDELVKSTRPALAKYGLSVLMPLSTLSAVCLRVTLAHADGGRIRTLVIVPGADDIKDAGGNLTYLSRYAYRALLALDGGEDADDKPRPNELGAESGPRTPRQEEPRRAPQTPQTQAKPANAQSQAAVGAQTRDAPKAQGAQPSTPRASAPSSQSSATTTKLSSATTTSQSAPRAESEAPKAQGAPATGQRTDASTASTPATSPAPAGTTAASPSSATAPAGTSGETPLTEEQRAIIYALLAKLGITGPQKAGAYLSSLMNRLGLTGKVTGESYSRVYDALAAELPAGGA